MNLLNKISNTLIIVNPEANERRALSTLKKVKYNFEKQKIPHDVIITQSRDETVYCVSKNKTHENILSLSGDGGMNAVIEGAMKNEQEKNLGIIAAGTANDISKYFDIYGNLNKLASILSNGYTKETNVGIVSGKYFLGHASIGFDSLVLHERNQRRFIKGKLAYFPAVFRALSKYNSKLMRITADKKEINKTTFMAVVSNIPYYADGMEIAPLAKINDNLLDLCLIHGKSNLGLLINSLLFANSPCYLQNPSAHYCQISELEISSLGKVLLQVDGDLVGENNYFKFGIAGRKLNMLCSD
jgi:diacylglycerol kinase (ATP)